MVDAPCMWYVIVIVTFKNTTHATSMQHAAFQACVFLLLNLWTSQKIQDMTATEVAGDMDHVRQCTEVLKACESRYCSLLHYFISELRKP